MQKLDVVHGNMKHHLRSRHTPIKTHLQIFSKLSRYRCTKLHLAKEKIMLL